MRTLRIRTVPILLASSLLFASCGGDEESPTGSLDPRPIDRGDLEIDISGLPPSVDASVRVTGPRDFDETLGGSDQFENVPIGSYTIVASQVSGAGDSYAPDVESATVTVSKANTSTLAIYYASTTGNTYDLRIASAYLVQTVQRLDGGVPLVAGRDAMLRAFVVSTSSQPIQPAIRVTLLDGNDGILLQQRVRSSATSTPTAPAEGSLASSWNLPIDGSIVVEGLQIRAEVDPDSEFDEVDETNNLFPAGGEALRVNVRALDDLQLRFVPVHQNATGLTGDVTASNVGDFTELAQKLYPTVGLDVDVRAVYSTNTRALEPDNANNTWSSVLGEINALRQAEAPGSSRHYYGVVDVEYGGGIAGIAYVGGWAGIGRDLAFSGLEIVFPHELGHNLGLVHAPCGVPQWDPDYPYPDARIGVYGLDVATSQVKQPFMIDLMAYCPDNWISDYNYEITFDRRETFGKAAEDAVGTQIEPCYLVWGSVVDGTPRLEPVLELDGRFALPRAGAHRLTLHAAGGASYELSFDPVTVADLAPASQAHFAYMVPVAALGGSELQSVDFVTSRGRRASRDRVARTADANPRLQRLDASRVLFQWDAAARPLVALRDERSGAILSFARGGRAEIVTDARAVELHLSDGARTVRRVLEIR